MAAIQAFAKAEFLSQIPVCTTSNRDGGIHSFFCVIQAFRWILYMNGGKFTNLINGYLPVVALLCLILILPVIFQIVALKYERRKTKSDVQASMLGRYFYYQLATIYITVTAVCTTRSIRFASNKDVVSGCLVEIACGHN